MAKARSRGLLLVWGVVAAALLGALVPGCATTRVQRAGASTTTVVLAPLNVFVGLPHELEASSDRVFDAMRGYLESHGKRVEVLSLAEARELWGRSIQKIERAEAPESFAAAAGTMARQLARQRRFDALVLPALYHRKARAAGGSARWDDAEARIRLQADDGAAGSSVAVRGYHGPIAAASLFVGIVSPGGTLIQEQLSGLELTEHITVVGGREVPMDADRWVVETDSPALDDEGMIRDGIARAFAPFLPAALEVAPD